jgi:MFS family permease
VTTSGYGITFFSRLLETSPEEHRPSYIAGYNTLINMAAFISPFIATSMTSVLDIRVLLIAGAVLRFFGSSRRRLAPSERDKIREPPAIGLDGCCVESDGAWCATCPTPNPTTF